jgi:tetratricopeptide (TPR) repeat protein
VNREPARELDVLLSNVAWAIERGLGANELVPMLEKVVARAPIGSPAGLRARSDLAELLIERAPWRAALLARQLIAVQEDDRIWGVLGHAHSMLGHYRAARAAYLRALSLAPGSVTHAHNLGHLLDVGLGRTREALFYLGAAYRGEPHEPEIAGSYALALAHAGRASEARELLCRSLGDTPRAAERRLRDWMRRCAKRRLAGRRSARAKRRR